MDTPVFQNTAPKKKDDVVENLFRLVHSGRVGLVRGQLIEASREERLKVLREIGICFHCDRDLVVGGKHNFYEPGKSKFRVCVCVGARMNRVSMHSRKSDGYE